VGRWEETMMSCDVAASCSPNMASYSAEHSIYERERQDLVYNRATGKSCGRKHRSCSGKVASPFVSGEKTKKLSLTYLVSGRKFISVNRKFSQSFATRPPPQANDCFISRSTFSAKAHFMIHRRNELSTRSASGGDGSVELRELFHF
jgi:hypothetical protein